jgi:3-hydroxyisobutyrate dehydrogenase
MKIGFLGLGAMGARMAARLVAAGHAVTVWNRSPGRPVPEGAGQAATPRQAVAGAEVALAMTYDDAAALAVWTEPETGALAGLSPGALAIDCATLAPETAQALHRAAAVRGVRFVEAPVAGSRPQAEAGQLVFLAGGRAEDVAAAAPVLSALGRATHHLGGPGAGAAVKLAVNAQLAAQVATLAETLALLVRSGLDPAPALAALADTAVASPALVASAGSMAARRFAPLAPVDLIVKDLGLALAAGAAVSQPLPMVEAARHRYAEAAARGHGGDHLTGVVQLYL